MARKITGTVDRVYFTSPKFTAGVLKTDKDAIVRFRGPFCANEGDCITLVGKWQKDPKYGPQFAAESLSYELPDSPEGLVQYLAKHPAFVGIGEATARKIVEYATSAANLDRLIRQDLDQLRQQLRIPKSTLLSLQEAWIAIDAIEQAQSLDRGLVRQVASEQFDTTRILENLLESLNSVSQPTK
jgi:exodeoxyribonuclease V alpha subunit